MTSLKTQIAAIINKRNHAFNTDGSFEPLVEELTNLSLFIEERNAKLEKRATGRLKLIESAIKENKMSPITAIAATIVDSLGVGDEDRYIELEERNAGLEDKMAKLEIKSESFREERDAQAKILADTRIRAQDRYEEGNRLKIKRNELVQTNNKLREQRDLVVDTHLGLTEKVSALEVELKSLRSKLTQKEDALNIFDGANKNQQAMIADLEVERNGYREERNEGLREVSILETSVADLKVEQDDYQEEIKGLRTDVENITNANTYLGADIKLMRGQVNDRDGEITELRATKKQYNHANKNQYVMIANQRKELENLTGANAKLVDAVEEQKGSIDQLNEAVTALDAVVKDTNIKLHVAEVDAYDLRKERNALKDNQQGSTSLDHANRSFDMANKLADDRLKDLEQAYVDLGAAKEEIERVAGLAAERFDDRTKAQESIRRLEEGISALRGTVAEREQTIRGLRLNINQLRCIVNEAGLANNRLSAQVVDLERIKVERGQIARRQGTVLNALKHQIAMLKNNARAAGADNVMRLQKQINYLVKQGDERTEILRQLQANRKLLVKDNAELKKEDARLRPLLTEAYDKIRDLKQQIGHEPACSGQLRKLLINVQRHVKRSGVIMNDRTTEIVTDKIIEALGGSKWSGLFTVASMLKQRDYQVARIADLKDELKTKYASVDSLKKRVLELESAAKTTQEAFVAGATLDAECDRVFGDGVAGKKPSALETGTAMHEAAEKIADRRGVESVSIVHDEIQVEVGSEAEKALLEHLKRNAGFIGPIMGLSKGSIAMREDAVFAYGEELLKHLNRPTFQQGGAIKHRSTIGGLDRTANVVSGVYINGEKVGEAEDLKITLSPEEHSALTNKIAKQKARISRLVEEQGNLEEALVLVAKKRD